MHSFALGCLFGFGFFSGWGGWWFCFGGGGGLGFLGFFVCLLVLFGFLVLVGWLGFF